MSKPQEAGCLGEDLNVCWPWANSYMEAFTLFIFELDYSSMETVSILLDLGTWSWKLYRIFVLCLAAQYFFHVSVIGYFCMCFSLTQEQNEIITIVSCLYAQVIQCWDQFSILVKYFSFWMQYKYFFFLYPFGSGYPVFKKTKWKIQTWTPCSNCSLSTYEDAQANFRTLIFSILCNFWSDWQANIYCEYKIFIFVNF